MKLIIQNVDKASVQILNSDNTIKRVESIKKWVLMYFAVSKSTTDDKYGSYKDRIDRFVDKFLRMRCLKDDKWMIGSTIKDIGWEILLISNFTLYASNKKWTKMDFSNSWSYERSEIIYNYFLNKLKESWVTVRSGEFGAMMRVESVNVGPINYILEI